MSNTNTVLTLQKIIDTEFSLPPPRVDRLIDAGETALFIARQKEGKSTLALQLGIDVSLGDAFLDRYPTTKGTVLCIDYENRLYRLKERGKDLAKGRKIENLHVKAFDYVSQRDVGLFGKEFEQLKELVQELMPGFLILDPLRYALNKINASTAEESLSVQAIDQVSKLHEINPQMAVVLVHHLKKRQDQGSRVILRDDPRSWIEQVYGSQALLAHVDTIWGLEEDGDGYTFATVPRSQDPLRLPLVKEPDSERFLLGSVEEFIFSTPAQREAWEKLPQEFGWREEVKKGTSNNLLRVVIRQARATGLLAQDSGTKRYRKVVPAEGA